MVGQVTYIFLTCDNPNAVNFAVNLTSTCNMNCSCDGVAYSPICFVPTSTTYFSPCHAACNKWDSKKKLYSNCACATELPTAKFSWNNSTNELKQINATSSEAINNNFKENMITSNTLSPTMMSTMISSNLTDYIDEYDDDNEYSEYEDDDVVQTRRRRSTNLLETDELQNILTPGIFSIRLPISMKFSHFILGVCLAGCAKAFYLFTFIMFAINWLGSTGRIGNVLLNFRFSKCPVLTKFSEIIFFFFSIFRAVHQNDKSFSQGLALMMVSMFAFTPGPILYGYIIDSTCLVWNYKCGNRGNCQLYDPEKFRYYVNCTATFLTMIGVFFDVLVWHYAKNIKLYGETDERNDISNLPETQSEQKHIKPLISKESLLL